MKLDAREEEEKEVSYLPALRRNVLPPNVLLWSAGCVLHAVHRGMPAAASTEGTDGAAALTASPGAGQLGQSHQGTGQSLTMTVIPGQ